MDDFNNKANGARIVDLGGTPANFLSLLAGVKEALWQHYPEFGPLAGEDSDYYEDFSTWFNEDGDLEDAYLHALVKNGKVEGLIAGGLTQDPHSTNGTVTYLVGSPTVKQALIEHAMASVDAEAFFIEQYNAQHDEKADPEEVARNTADRAFFAGKNAEQVPLKAYNQPVGPDDETTLDNLDLDAIFWNQDLTPEQKSETTLAFLRGYARNYDPNFDDPAQAVQRNLDQIAGYTRDLQDAQWVPLAESKPDLIKSLNLDLE